MNIRRINSSLAHLPLEYIFTLAIPRPCCARLSQQLRMSELAILSQNTFLYSNYRIYRYSKSILVDYKITVIIILFTVNNANLLAIHNFYFFLS